MAEAWSRTASRSAASFTPPALPRPPVWTWALTTTGSPSPEAAATASVVEKATSPEGTGSP